MTHHNGAIHALSAIVKDALVSTAEHETGAIFENFQDTVTIHFTLEELVHPQPAMSV